MATLFVARSAALSDWASDVGLSKNVFKVGVAADPAADPVADIIARGWAGEGDWALVRSLDGIDLGEEEVIAKIAKREKMIDPRYYPRLREAQGVFKVNPDSVKRGIVLARAMAGENERAPIKLKTADFGAYLIGLVQGGLAL